MTAKRDLLDRLGGAEELELTVTGRKTGRRIGRPVWFVLRDRSLLLLPQFGPSTNWYRNIIDEREVEISVGKGPTVRAKIIPVVDQKRVLEVVRLFTVKYGKENMDRYYRDTTVAAEVGLADGNA